MSKHRFSASTKFDTQMNLKRKTLHCVQHCVELTVWTRHQANRDSRQNPRIVSLSLASQRQATTTRPVKTPVNWPFSDRHEKIVPPSRLHGGGSSHGRTGLCRKFPANREFTGNSSNFGAKYAGLAGNITPISKGLGQIP